jgi:hypothetical protein
MRFVGENDSLREQFGATGASGDFAANAQLMLAPTDRERAEQVTRVTAKLRDDELHGQKSGSIESVIKSSAAATKDARNSRDAKAERQSKERFSDAMLLALLNSGDLDNVVAENIFGGMSDVEISEIVAQIEAESGKNFEDYAQDILGDDMPDRIPGESDADYHRRLLIAAADVVLEDDLSIRPGYENDPLARIIAKDEMYKATLERVTQLNASTPADVAPSRESKAEAANIAAEGYMSGDVVSVEVKNEELAAVGRDGQDDDRDGKLNAAPDSLGGFGAFSALGSADAKSPFNLASAEKVEPTDPEMNPELTPNLSLDS